MKNHDVVTQKLRHIETVNEYQMLFGLLFQ